jgi:hypothetical protein
MIILFENIAMMHHVYVHYPWRIHGALRVVKMDVPRVAVFLVVMIRVDILKSFLICICMRVLCSTKIRNFQNNFS